MMFVLRTLLHGGEGVEALATGEVQTDRRGVTRGHVALDSHHAHVDSRPVNVHTESSGEQSGGDPALLTHHLHHQPLQGAPEPLQSPGIRPPGSLASSERPKIFQILFLVPTLSWKSHLNAFSRISK